MHAGLNQDGTRLILLRRKTITLWTGIAKILDRYFVLQKCNAIRLSHTFYSFDTHALVPCHFKKQGLPNWKNAVKANSPSFLSLFLARDKALANHQPR
jgi:hypothetical protein